MANQYQWMVAIHVDRPDVADGYCLKLEGGPIVAEPGADLEDLILRVARERLQDHRPPRIRTAATADDSPAPSIAEAAMKSPEQVISDLRLDLAREAERADKAEERAANHAKRIDRLEGEALTLVEALTGGSYPPPWWLTASRALDNLDALARHGASYDEISPSAP